MFFPGLHLGPRACSPQANQQMNRGQEAGLRSDCHTVKKKRERGRQDWGSLVRKKLRWFRFLLRYSEAVLQNYRTSNKSDACRPKTSYSTFPHFKLMLIESNTCFCGVTNTLISQATLHIFLVTTLTLAVKARNFSTSVEEICQLVNQQNRKRTIMYCTHVWMRQYLRNQSTHIFYMFVSLSPLHQVFWRSSQWMWEWWPSGASAAITTWQSARGESYTERWVAVSVPFHTNLPL